jgi:proline racemase
MRRLKTIDAEVAGEPVRLLIEGAPSINGRTMREKLAWLRRNHDELRRILMLEPRGHAAMHGALLTEPVTSTSASPAPADKPGAHAGLLSMHAGGYPLISGEGIIAAVTIALQTGLIDGVSGDLVLDTPVGPIRVQSKWAREGAGGATGARGAEVHVTSVTLTGLPSFVHTAGVSVRLGSRTVAVDVAFGGEFYAIADSESIGVPMDIGHSDRLVRAGIELKQAVEAALTIAHPVERHIKGIHGTIFTSPPTRSADLRSATVLHDEGAIVRRSPGITGTAALLAVVDAMGLFGGDQTFTHEGLTGTLLRASVECRQTVGEVPAVVPAIEGSASITGYHEFVVSG